MPRKENTAEKLNKENKIVTATLAAVLQDKGIECG
jgi:hypothetical protein